MERESYIACMDTGSLDFFGPYVVVSCFIDKQDIQELEKLDFDDYINTGKYLKDHLVYSLLLIDNSHYNALLDKGYKTAKIKATTLNRAIINVVCKTQNNVDIKVISSHLSSKTYYHHLKQQVVVARNVVFNEDDDSIGIKCARALCKYARYQYLCNMNQALHIDLPLGSSKEVNDIGVELVNRYGLNILNKTCKKHMPNYNQIIELANKN